MQRYNRLIHNINQSEVRHVNWGKECIFFSVCFFHEHVSHFSCKWAVRQSLALYTEMIPTEMMSTEMIPTEMMSTEMMSEMMSTEMMSKEMMSEMMSTKMWLQR